MTIKIEKCYCSQCKGKYYEAWTENDNGTPILRTGGYDSYQSALEGLSELLAENNKSVNNWQGVKHDHKLLKHQIKTWELTLEVIVESILDNKLNEIDIIKELEAMSHEMMSINL